VFKGGLYFRSRYLGLTKLNVSYNSLEGLPAQIGDLSSLVTLDVSNNMLTILPDEIKELSQLRLLDISSNGDLGGLPDEPLLGLRRLVILRATDSGLNSLPDSIALLPKLQVLDVSRNNLASLPSALLGSSGSPMTKLRALLAANNVLAALSADTDTNSTASRRLDDETETAASRLELLQVRGNSLTSLPAALIRRLSKVCVIDVQENSLTNLDGDALLSLAELEVIAAEGNMLDAETVTALGVLKTTGVATDEEGRTVCTRVLDVEFSVPCVDSGGNRSAGDGALSNSSAVGGTSGGCPSEPMISTFCIAR